MSDGGALRGLFLALEDPDAPPLCLAALADWYEERGDTPAADCLRWAAERDRRPGLNTRPTFGAYFWELDGPDPLFDAPRARLPGPLWRALGENGEPHPVGTFKSYLSVQAAYLALIAGWKRVGGAPGPGVR